MTNIPSRFKHGERKAFVLALEIGQSFLVKGFRRAHVISDNMASRYGVRYSVRQQRPRRKRNIGVRQDYAKYKKLNKETIYHVTRVS